jgi:flavin reductase (DIM6/NTAB) family NADH-FMN oxidoreductase RutF
MTTAYKTISLSLNEDSQARSLRDLFGHWATGVAVVTTVDSVGRRVGLTVNTFAALSLDPALILWCLDKNSDNLEAFDEAKYFAVTVLKADQKELGLKFAAQEERFQDTLAFKGDNGMPVLEGGIAFMECTRQSVVDAGDHVIIIGRVTRFGTSDGDPLMFYKGQFENL